MKTHTHDKIGIWSSILCIVHCLAVPVVMAYGNGLDLHENHWWDVLQVVFIAIAFWAVKHAVGHTPLTWMKGLFWLSFTTLVISMIFHHSALGEVLNYGAALTLIALHALNLYLARQKKSLVA